MAKPGGIETVEDRGRRYAEKAQERMWLGTERVVAIVRERDLRLMEWLEPLAGKKAKHPTDARYHPLTGGCYYTTWQERKTTQINDDRVLQSPQGASLSELVVLLPRSARNDPTYLRHLPKKVPVQLLLLHHAETIDEAIAKVEEILGAEIRQQAQKVVAYTIGLSARFIEGGLMRESLGQLLEETSGFLAQAGLVSPDAPSIKKTADSLRKACQLDSLARVNPLISRVRLQSAYIWAMRRYVVDFLSRRKHGESFEVFLWEREISRWSIADAIKQLNIFLTQEAFAGKGIAENRRTAMARVLNGIARGPLAQVRVAPYLRPVRLAGINLVGCQEERREVNRIILGEVADWLYLIPPVTELVGEGRFEEALPRIEKSRDILKGVLEENAVVSKSS
ncbi:MAG: hypothetical protein ACOZBZ_04810 [Patescibacteria group bacterium]